MWLFLAFLIVPLIEIGLFIQVGGWIGLLPTLAVVVLTAIAGAVLVRRQGLAVLRKLQAPMAGVEDLTRPIADGAMILFSGALLLTPGFFTDAVGFTLLIPAVRGWVYQLARERIHFETFGASIGTEPYGPTIEGTFEEADDPAEKRNPSTWTKD